MFTNQEYFNKHVKDLALILLSLLLKAVNGSKAIKGSIQSKTPDSFHCMLNYLVH